MAGVETFKTDFSALREGRGGGRETKVYLKDSSSKLQEDTPMDFFDFFFLTHDTQKTIPITVRGGKKIYIYKMEILEN